MGYDGGPMTEAMYYVLLALFRPNHGYQLMQSIHEVSNGRVQMGPGTLYGILTRMQKEGFIEKKHDDGRRKTYEITKYGELALRAEFRRLQAMITDGQMLNDK